MPVLPTLEVATISAPVSESASFASVTAIPAVLPTVIGSSDVVLSAAFTRRALQLSDCPNKRMAEGLGRFLSLMFLTDVRQVQDRSAVLHKPSVRKCNPIMRFRGVSVDSLYVVDRRYHVHLYLNPSTIPDSLTNFMSSKLDYFSSLGISIKLTPTSTVNSSYSSYINQFN